MARDKHLFLSFSHNLSFVLSNPLKQVFAASTLCLGAAMLCTACIDDSYDLSKDIDMTVGLGGDGLGVRLGNTEPITLDNILDVDQSVKLDASNLYYLVETGTTEVTFNVANANTSIRNSLINTIYHVLDYASTRTQYEQTYGVSVPDGTPLNIPADFAPKGTADGESKVTLTVNNVDAAIRYLSSVTITPVRLSLRVENISSDGVKFGLRSMDNVRIQLPPMLRVSNPTAGRLEGNTLIIDHVDCSRSTKVVEVTATRVVLDDDGTPTANHDIVISDRNARISITSDVNFGCTSAFTMHADDYADVKFDICVNDLTTGEDTPVDILTATGRFDPAIAPEVEPIDVSGSLPDFLQDDGVTLPAINPTMRFTANMTQIPVDLTFSALLKAEKSGTADRPVVLPANGTANLTAAHANTLYFYQGNAPYDPEQSVSATAQKHQVANLSTLINPLPDRISVDLTGGRVRVPQTEDYTVELGRTYRAAADYAVFVPFEFREGLTIVYNDSTNSLHDDLKDYAAEGVRINAKVENTIPLALVGTIRAVDVDGNEMPGVSFSEVRINAGNGGDTPELTDVQVEATLSDPNDLRRIDRLYFNVHAASGETTTAHTLVSTQYLRLRDIRLRLTGRIIADFN